MGKDMMRKKALVTGASHGIGKGIALVLASRGYDVAITYHAAEEEAKKIAQHIRQEYAVRCVVLQADLADEETATNLVGKAIEELGGLDVLVNNAGLTLFSPLSEMDAGDLNHLIHLNFRGPLLTMKYAVKHMKSQQVKGNIINIASTRGQRAYPNDAVYGGMKAALIRATQSAALECSSFGIRVNCIAPGATAVREDREEQYKKLGNKIPLKRVGTPEDVGEAAAWLISDQASYITGETLRIDGGLILPGMPEDVRPEAGYGWAER